MSRIVAFGEIMCRLATPGQKRFGQAMPGQLDTTFAGAEASAAVSIAHLGGRASFVTALPDHALAEACLAQLRSFGVETEHILRVPQGRLGLFFYEAGSNQRPANVIYDRENSSVSITPAATYDWDAIFEGAEWLILSGITPAISKNAAEVTEIAMQQAQAHGVKIACDMNYRSKLWNWDPSLKPRELASQTMRKLLPYVTLFLGGEQDAAEILGITPDENSEQPLLDIARQISKRYPQMTHIAMTLRECFSANHHSFGGVLYVREQDEIFHAPMRNGQYQPYQITDIVDRLGGGDAFTAGLLFAMGDPELNDPQNTINFATAAACLSHSFEGDYNLATRAEIETLMHGDLSGRVNR